MLITMLKGRKKGAVQEQLRRLTSCSRSTVVDISGPRAAAPAVRPVREPATYRGTAPATSAVRPVAQRIRKTEMSDLPRALDPFEDDFPWIGWTQPRHDSVVRSDHRSPTFEADMERVLRIFSN